MINKKAIEVPDNIAQWEDVVMDYVDKQYPYLANGIKNISFSKKEEAVKDGIGAIQYKSGGVEMTIPIIIDDGELKEPNIGIYKDQIIPINEDIFNWLTNNAQSFGQLIQRDSQHIGNMDYLQQTGLFEEPDVGGYKSACTRETAERIRKEAAKYAELQWLVEKLDKVAAYQPDEYLVGMDLANADDGAGIYTQIGRYATVTPDALPKIATVIANPGNEHKLAAMPPARSPFRRQPFMHKFMDTYFAKVAAEEEGAKENELIRIAEADTFGGYIGVLANQNGAVNTYKGTVQFDVQPLYGPKSKPIALVMVDEEPSSPDPEDLRPPTTDLPIAQHPEFVHQHKAVLGDVWGIKKGFHHKKADGGSVYPPFEPSFNMGDNVMVQMGKDKYSIPYAVDSKVSGMIGANMENVVVLCLRNILDDTRIDAIISDISELKTIRRTSIKEHQLQSMLRTPNPTVLLIPSGSVFRGPGTILMAADKGKMVADIINGMPDTNYSAVVKISGAPGAQSYEIAYRDGEAEHLFNTTNEKLANALASYFIGDEITAEQAAAEGRIPLVLEPEYAKMRKVADIIAANTDAYLAVAGTINRSISQHFAKAAGVSGLVNDLIGVSFVDKAREVDAGKISEQVMTLINSLGNLILMARLGKTSIPEVDVNRAFWSLADLVSVLRG